MVGANGSIGDSPWCRVAHERPTYTNFLTLPILDVLQLFGATADDDVEHGKLLLSRVVAMLTKMCR